MAYQIAHNFLHGAGRGSQVPPPMPRGRAIRPMFTGGVVEPDDPNDPSRWQFPVMPQDSEDIMATPRPPQIGELEEQAPPKMPEMPASFPSMAQAAPQVPTDMKRGSFPTMPEDPAPQLPPTDINRMPAWVGQIGQQAPPPAPDAPDGEASRRQVPSPPDAPPLSPAIRVQGPATQRYLADQQRLAGKKPSMLQNILGGVLQAAPAISRRFAPLARIDVHPNLTRERENLEIERQGAQSELALQRAQELAEEHRSKIGLDAENRAILAQQRGDLAEAARIRAENARKPRYNFLTVGDGLFNADLGQWVQMPSSKGKAEDDALREYLDPNTSSERRDLLKGALQTMRGHWDPTYDLGPGHVRTDAAGNPIATGAPIPPRRNPGSGPTPAQQNATKVNEAVGKLRIKHGDNVAPAVDEAKTLYANDPAMFAAVEKQLRQRAPRATQKPAMSPGLRQFLGLPEDGQTAQQSTHKAGDRVSYQGKTYSVKSVNSDGSLVLE